MTIDSTRILVGLDGSDSSIDALRRAAVIAAALHNPLEAIITWDYPMSLGAFYPPGEWSPEENAHEIVTTALGRAFPDGPPADLTISYLQGSAAAVLVEQSERASMLVLGSRGHGGFAGMLLGSVSATCAQHAHCPVLVMHQSSTP